MTTHTAPTTARPLLHDAAGDGDPLVLLPGALSGWASWQHQAGQLATTRRAIRVQLRSVELAEAGQPLPAGYGTPTELDALGATLDALGLASFDLVGWSYGGSVALSYALRQPGRVRTLTLVEPGAYWVLRGAGRAAEVAQADAIGRRLADRELTRDDLIDFLHAAGFGGPGTDFEATPSWPLWLRNRQALGAMRSIVAHEESLSALAALTMPVLVVRGTASSPDLMAIAGELAAAVPGAEMLELPGGHACHLEQGAAFLAALERHLASG